MPQFHLPRGERAITTAQRIDLPRSMKFDETKTWMDDSWVSTPCVYIFLERSQCVVKIGKARKGLIRRWRDHYRYWPNSTLEALWFCDSPDHAGNVEGELLDRFSKYRQRDRGREWFDSQPILAHLDCPGRVIEASKKSKVQLNHDRVVVEVQPPIIKTRTETEVLHEKVELLNTQYQELRELIASSESPNNNPTVSADPTRKRAKYVRDISGLLGRGRTLREAIDYMINKTGDKDGFEEVFKLMERQLS